MGSGGIADSEIAELNRSIDRIASGDLTHRVDRNWDHSELDSLAASTNELVRDIESVLIETQSFGVQVSRTTDRVSARTTELRREMETATDAVDATVSAATRQRELLREVRADIMTLSRTLGNVTASAGSVASLSTRALREAQATADLDKPSQETFEELQKEAMGTARTLERVESTTDDIVSTLKDGTTSDTDPAEHARSASTALADQADTLDEIDRQTDDLADVVTDLGRTLRSFSVGAAGESEQVALTNPAYETAVQYVEAHNEALLDRSEELVVAYTEQEQRDFTDEVNIAGRQRMLSQRIAKKTFFIARNERAGANSEAVREAKADLQRHIEEFDHALETLAAGGTHREIDLQHAPRGVLDEIDRVRAVWEPFKKNALTIVDQSRFNQEAVESLDL